jgi:hypothetical protein
LTYGKVYMAVPGRVTWSTPQIELTEFEEFHLFGDPEMSVWTAQPTALTVTHPAAIGSGGPQQFVVTVRDITNQPVNDAAVGLLKDGDIHTAGYTNPSGYVIFNVTPSSAGNMDITVTTHNHLPYEGTMTVTGNGASIAVSPDAGPPGIMLAVTGSHFSAGETVNINLGGTFLGSVAASGGSFSTSFSVPVVPEGPANVTATGQTSGRKAVAAFRVFSVQPLPDPYLYSQWDSTTWHLNPWGGDPVWNNPSIQLREQSTGNPISSGNLQVGTPYVIEATIHNNHTAVAATGISVTFKWAFWAVGQKVWNTIDTQTVDIPAATVVPITAVAKAVWTPTITGHCCLVVEVHHPWDADLKNNKGQENTTVHWTSSPGEIQIGVYNPTDQPALVTLEVTQSDPNAELWATRIERPYPQVLDPNGHQMATLNIIAPESARTGETRTLSVTGTIDGEVIGGVEVQVVKDRPPTLTEGYVDPNGGRAGTAFTYFVTYIDADNHPPMEGHPMLAVFKGGRPIDGSPFTMEATSPGDRGYIYGNVYVCTVTLSELGSDYTYCFYARDSLGVDAEGPATDQVSGPLILEPVPQ